MPAQQLPLHFEASTAYTELDFVPGPANEDARKWIARWPNWPHKSLALHGPAGAGKTHLANIWAKRVGAALIAGKALDVSGLHQLARQAVVVDDAADAPEEALFHLINLQRERGEGLLVTLPHAPARMTFRLADLASRLGSFALAELTAPDDQMLAAVLAKQFADRQLRASDDVLSFLVPRMERSFAAARSLVAALDEATLSERRNLTVPFARDVLAKLGGN